MDLYHAINYTYYRKRLADPALLNEALITECGDLAVPVGGTRRGGWTTVMSIAEGEQLIKRMRETDQDLIGLQLPERFPNPRFAFNDEVIAFGDIEPFEDEAAGRYYGYSEEAISEFMQRMHVSEG